MPESALHPMLVRALGYMATSVRSEAAQLAVMSQVGCRDREIASMLGMSWFAMNSLRADLQGCVVSVLREDGYSDNEVTSYLRVPSAQTSWPTVSTASAADPPLALASVR